MKKTTRSTLPLYTSVHCSSGLMAVLIMVGGKSLGKSRVQSPTRLAAQLRARAYIMCGAGQGKTELIIGNYRYVDFKF